VVTSFGGSSLGALGGGVEGTKRLVLETDLVIGFTGVHALGAIVAHGQHGGRGNLFSIGILEIQISSRRNMEAAMISTGVLTTIDRHFKSSKEDII